VDAKAPVRARAALVLFVAGLSLGALSAGPALAADECRGLQVCLPVAGPWVVVPPGGVDYEVVCPLAGYIVAGTDARVAARDVDVSFRGEPGSPVGPGVTTRRSTVFHAVRTRPGAGATSFQPFIGCIPTNGGGGRALTGVAARTAGVKPTQSLRSIVVSRPVPSGSLTVRAVCPAGSRFVASTHAVAFRLLLPPPEVMLGAVRVRSTIVERVVVAHVTATPAAGARAEVQLRALCARAR
jgi:hypothetical protein